MYAKNSKTTFLRLLLLSFASVVLLAGCKTTSSKPYVEPTPPRVSCKQRAGDVIPPAPQTWVTCKARNGGDCWLSEEASTFIVGLLGVITVDRELRQTEHECLDKHESEGIITQ